MRLLFSQAGEELRYTVAGTLSYLASDRNMVTLTNVMATHPVMGDDVVNGYYAWIQNDKNSSASAVDSPFQLSQENNHFVSAAAIGYAAITIPGEPTNTGVVRTVADAKEILFIDSAVAEIASLIAGTREGVEIVVLDAQHDPWAQMTEIITQHRNILAVHIVSHGSEGQIVLGGKAYNDSGLQTESAYISTWQSHLTTGADILVYGCDVASGPNGTTFINSLARISAADVVASTDTTGAVTQGGNWVLEKQTGSIETSLFASSSALAMYDSTLAVTAATFTALTATNDTTPTLTGTYTSGSSSNTLYLWDGSTRITTTAPTIGASQTGASWSWTTSTLTDGSHTFYLTTSSTSNSTGLLATLGNVTIDTTAPVLASAVIGGTTLTLTYSETGAGLAVITPAPGDFSVTKGAGNTVVTVNSVAINDSAKSVTLTLASAITINDTNVKVSYTPGSDPNAIRDVAGNIASSFTNTLPIIESPQTVVVTTGTNMDPTKATSGLIGAGKLITTNPVTLTTGTTSNLMVINAYDVDYGMKNSTGVPYAIGNSASEWDGVYIKLHSAADSPANWKFVGFLAGFNNTWNTTTFDITSSLTGLGSSVGTTASYDIRVVPDDNGTQTQANNGGRWVVGVASVQVVIDGGDTSTRTASMVGSPSETNAAVSVNVTPATSATYTVQFNLIDASGHYVAAYSKTVPLTSGTTATISGSLLANTTLYASSAFSNVPSGNYTLQVNLLDASGTLQDTKSVAETITSSGGSVTTSSTATATSIKRVGIGGNTSWAGNSSADLQHIATTDTTPTIVGTYYSTSNTTKTIDIYDNGVKIGSTSTANYNSTTKLFTWSYTPSSTLSLGTHDFYAQRNGKTTTNYISSTYELIIDGPVQPTISAPVSTTLASPTSTANANYTLTGTSSPLIDLWVYDGNNVIGATTADKTGAWSFTVPSNSSLTNGTHTLTVKDVTDVGFGSATSASHYLSVTSSAPTLFVSGIHISVDTGSSATDFVTASQQQNITATLSGALGSNHLLGSLDGGLTWTDITSYVSGTAITWSSQLLRSGYADSSQYVPWQIQFKVSDNAGSPQYGAVSGQDYHYIGYISDPTITRQGWATAGTPTLYGMADPNSVVTVKNGSTILGTAVPDAQGNWSFTPASPFPDGTYTLTASAQDTYSGAAALQSASVTLIIDLNLPVISNIAISADSGSSNSDFITSTAAQNITAVLSQALSANQKIWASLDGGTTWQDIVAHGGSVSVTSITWNNQTLSGSNSIEFQARNSSTNTQGAIATQDFVVDTTAPILVTSGNAATYDSNDQIVTLVFNEASSGLDENSVPATSAFTVSGGSISAVTVDAAINSVILTVSSTVTSVTYTKPGSGSTLRDLAGNEVATFTKSVTDISSDTTAPASPSIALSAASDSGPLNNDDKTNTGTPTVRVSLPGTGSGSTTTGPVAGDTVEVFNNGVSVGTAILGTNDVSNKYVDITLASLGSDGTKSLTATETDAAGNVSGTNTLSVILDTTSPTLNTASVNGASLVLSINELGSGLASAAQSPSLSSSNFTVTRNGATPVTVSSFAVDTTAQTVTLTLGTSITSADNVTLSYTAGANRLQDIAGNQFASLSSLAVINNSPDLTAPAAPALTLNAGSDSGTLNSDAKTSIDTPSVRVAFNGTGSTKPAIGDTLKVYLDASQIGTTVLSWSDINNGYADITTTTLGSDGTKSLTAKITDQSNNVSAASNVLTVTIDKTAPSISSAVASVSTLTLTYSESGVGVADTTPLPADFILTKGSSNDAVSVTGVSVDATAKTVTLTLGTALINADSNILISYTPGTNKIQDIAGNTAASLTSMAVTNVTNVNNAPTAISLSAAAIAENNSAGATVATLSATDPDGSETFTYTLVSGHGDTDNTAFTIAGDQLKINASANFEAQSSYSIRLKVTDHGGLSYETSKTISVSDLNEAPTAISLSAAAIAENNSAGATVATLSATDPDGSETFTYTLVSGHGDTDNTAFTIAGDQLKINASANFEAQSSYSIRLKVTDHGGLSYETSKTISVSDLNEAPTVSAITSTKSENDSSYTLNLLSGAHDADTSDVLSVTDYSAAAVDGSALSSTIPTGALSLSGSTLAVDPTKFDFLAAGESRVITASYNVYDGLVKTANTAAITITGANDAPVAVAATDKTTGNAPPITGLLTATDADILGTTATFALNAPIAGLTLKSDGHYLFDPSDAAYKHLAAGKTLEVVADYTVTDDHGATDTSTLTITVTGIDTPTLTVSSVTVSESSPFAVVAVNLDSASTSDVKFTPTLVSGTATAGSDTGHTLEFFDGHAWLPLSGAATIPVGSTSALLRTAITNDSVYEGSESLTVTTGLLDGSVLNTEGASSTITIEDDGTSSNVFTESSITATPSTGSSNDDHPAISVSSVTVNESLSHAMFSVSLSNTLTTDVSFTPSLAADSATLTSDFGPSLEYFNGTAWASIPSGGVTIFAGTISVQLRTPLVHDLNFAEGTERFIVSTGSVTGNVHNTAGASGIVSITDMKQLSDPVITDVTETATDPTPYDLLTADTTQIITVKGEPGSSVALFKLDSHGNPDPVAGALFTTDDNSGTYTLDFGSNVLTHGDYVVQLTKNNAASSFSNAFTIDSTPGLYDITGQRKIVTISATESATIGAVGGMDQYRLPTHWNGTDWTDSDGEIIRFSFNSPTSFDQGVLPSANTVISTSSSGSTLAINTQSGAYTYNPEKNATLDKFTLYASDGHNGSALVLTFDAKDTLDRDGISSSVETRLAALANPEGGTTGDLNKDGIPDANQNAVTTLAWINDNNYLEALAGTLTDPSPVISIQILQSTSGSTVDNSAQLFGVQVLAPTSDITGGSKPANAQWDPITFSVEPLQSVGLLDADPSREGTQVRIMIDISHSMTPEGSFTGYEKYVSAELVASGIKDFDGNLITTPGWYDFTQRVAGGDGARFITNGGYITGIELTITDNAFGDDNMTVGRIYDPGVPVSGNTIVPLYSVQSGGNDRKIFSSLTDAGVEATSHSTSPVIDFYGVTKTGNDTVALKAWYNTVTGDWFYAPEGSTPPYDCYVQQEGTLGRAMAIGKGAFDVHLYLNSSGITQIMGEAEANALGLTSRGYTDKGALFASAAPAIIAFSPDDGSTYAHVQDNIVLSFSEGIQHGAGTIAIHSGSATGDLVESFDAATDTTHLLFSGSKLTIDPGSNLSAGTHYFVTLEGGSVIDLAGNHYPGSSEYEFWTDSVHNAEMAVTASGHDSGGGSEIIIGASAIGLIAWLAF